MMNTLMIILILAVFAGGVFWYFNKSKKIIHAKYDIEEDMFSVEFLVQKVKDTFNNILKTNLYEMNLSKEEFAKRIQNKSQLRLALKNCTYGDINAKNYIKDFIRDILVKNYKIDEVNITKIINFDNPKELSIQDKFEILMHIYKIKNGYRALEKIIMDNGLDNPKTDEYGQPLYVIKADEINKIYNKNAQRLATFEDRLSIVVQRIYQLYKGYGVIDEIRDMKIDGVSGGVSGIPPSFFQESELSSEVFSSLPASYDSVWIFFKGKTIHLSFLSFGTEYELMRVCKNIYRYNNPGQLSESNGYKVNEMKDGSRIVVARPPFSESWVFFVRKFDSVDKAVPEDLIVDKNKQLPIGFVKWLIKGCRITAITGSQGTGKTTLLMSIVRFINPTFTLRIQEMAFELHLRKLYPFRNILTFRETTTVSGQEGLDLQKKTDGTVNILGEVADAKVASWMIQMAQVASLFTMFTHHAKTTGNLVLALRNCLLQTGVFNNEKIAEKQVADVVNFDVHLNKDISGHRYIERITEIIPLSQDIEYPEGYKGIERHEEKQDSFLDTMKEYFVRVTDRKVFETRDIIVWENGEYKAGEPVSPECYSEMARHMTGGEREEFKAFTLLNWGVSYE
ncbi:pilus assembly protein CpaF [Anaerobacterium chartisolvens]|uniref:Pilus assembly protein CpaF n=1 Tax=Anaerobacterium chartisolvens TaxID=1297424 RepID=A0A369AXR9_9FIRM|nr:ATPase, T2SS/T4P/T4SS family [Anaerobacterium chartisolvens]RCX13007.1 pilus assembly protein CpaF [Anaerobacterium chartisolvens]